MSFAAKAFVGVFVSIFDSSLGFRSAGAALVRAVVHDRLPVPSWPDLTVTGPGSIPGWIDWIRRTWDVTEIAEFITYTSPVLTRQVKALLDDPQPVVREVNRIVLSLVRYIQRMRRPTPFGPVAGVAVARFGQRLSTRWGRRHLVTPRADAEWLRRIIEHLETCPDLVRRLHVVANSTLIQRGDRLIVPYRLPAAGGGVVDVSLRHTPAVRTVIEAARFPIRVVELATKLKTDFPAAGDDAVMAMLNGLVAQHALTTCLHAPSTEPNALAHLVEQLEIADALSISGISDLVRELTEVWSELFGAVSQPRQGARNTDLAQRMLRISTTDRYPLAVDTCLDTSIVLPHSVAREAERAALALTMLAAHPYGTSAWKQYHQRFYERFGIGSMVPLRDVVDVGSGIGWPDGYPNTENAEAASALSKRDIRLIAIAQRAALDGHDEILLDDSHIAALGPNGQAPRLPAHLELNVRVHADNAHAVNLGQFMLEVVSVSRSAGALMGRFLAVLPPDERALLAETLRALPTDDPETIRAQLSFPPLDPNTAHVARSLGILPNVISLAEHRHADAHTLTVDDLAVACDGRRMYLAAPALGTRVEAVALHALNLRRHTPPLARLLIELSRAHNAQVTAFDWGPAASALPFRPRLRFGRTILAAAMWRLDVAELPPKNDSWHRWDDVFSTWRDKRRIPRWTSLIEGDQRLPLDLDEPAHRVLLRHQLTKAGHVTLAETRPAGDGWIGRPHEVTVPLVAKGAPDWPRLPTPSRARVIGRDHGEAPGNSRTLFAKLYGSLADQDVVLTDHLPRLLHDLGANRLVAAVRAAPAWWFLRYRDPDQHLRVRMTLSTPDCFGKAAKAVSAWTHELHLAGLLREVQYVTSWPETGRWGGDNALEAAENVFACDSQAVLTQLAQRPRPARQALVAAHAVAISAAFTGSTQAGMRWLIDHIPAKAAQPVARPLFDEAVRLANPDSDWSALRNTPGGQSIVDSWKPRDAALRGYRSHLDGPHAIGIDPHDVLGSLLHAHVIRAIGIDFAQEAVCHHLARAAALAWTERKKRARQ